MAANKQDMQVQMRIARIEILSYCDGKDTPLAFAPLGESIPIKTYTSEQILRDIPGDDGHQQSKTQSQTVQNDGL